MQSVTLQYQADQTVATADKPPVVLGRMPDSFVQKVGSALRCAKLIPNLHYDCTCSAYGALCCQLVGLPAVVTVLFNARSYDRLSCLDCV